MNKVKEIINYLLHGDYFDTMLEHGYALALTVGLFLAIGYFYIFHPVILVYLLIAGMLFVGWFMMYLLLPGLHDQVQRSMRFVVQLFRKYFQS